MIMFNMFNWLIKFKVFKNLLTKINMLNHHYVDSFVEFVSNVIYFFLQAFMFQNVELYLHYVILRKNYRLCVLILFEFLWHWWNEVTFQRRYLYESLSNLIYNNHENRLLTIINFTKQNTTNCTRFCKELSQSFNEWTKKLMQRD